MKILKILFSLSVIFLILGQFSVLFRDSGLNLYIFDFMVSIFSVIGLFYFLSIRRSLILPSVFIIFSFFTLIAVVSLLLVLPNYDYTSLLVGSSYLLRWISYLLASVVIYNCLYSKDNYVFTLPFITNVFVNSGVFLTFVGLIQLSVFPDLGVLDPLLGWDPHKYRMFSTFLDPNFVGAYLSIVVIFVIDKYYKSLSFNSNVKFYLWDLVRLLILIIGIILTFSRSAWILFSLIIFIYGLYKSKLMLFTFFIVIFCAYFAVPRIQTRISGITDPSDSAHFRIISWNNTLAVAKDNLLFGVGFNMFKYASLDAGVISYDDLDSHNSSGSDSSLLLVLATTGIFGFLFYFGSFIYVWFHSNNLIVKSLIIGILANSMFINSLFYPQIMFVLLISLVNSRFFDNLQ